MTQFVRYRIDAGDGRCLRTARKRFFDRLVLPRLRTWCSRYDLVLTESEDTDDTVVELLMPDARRSQFLSLVEQVLCDARAQIAARYPQALMVGSRPLPQRRPSNATAELILCSTPPPPPIVGRPLPNVVLTPVEMVIRVCGDGPPRIENRTASQLTIGRSGDCDVPLLHPTISRIHARLIAEPRGLVLMDLGSANGLYVNGMRVAQALIRPGDEITIGSITLYVSVRP